MVEGVFMSGSQPCPDVERLEWQKRAAAARAVELVESGMVVGLGGGSTAALAMRCLAEALRAGRLRDVFGIPCSHLVEAEARRLSIPLTTLEERPAIDLTIDGADEVDPDLNLIKGAGGALLWEKIVAQASRREIIVVDSSKPSPRLGTLRPLLIEVVPFGWGSQRRFLESLGARVTRREDKGEPFYTDQGNFILNCAFGPIGDAADLARRLGARAGIVEHGLFIGLATDLIVAAQDGITHTTRPRPAGS
jgi:ribose 5-phosphate isomerase A